LTWNKVHLFLQAISCENTVMGANSIISIHSSPKPSNVIFFQCELVWKNGFRHGSQNKVAIEIAYILMQEYWNFWRMNERICKTQVKLNKNKNLTHKKKSRSQQLRHTWYTTTTYNLGFWHFECYTTCPRVN
jgi:hypothetical protein